MTFLTTFHRQTATWWRLISIDGFGNPTFDIPAQIKVRWEDKTEYIINADGVSIPSRSRIFLGQTVSVGDYLSLGIRTATDPRSVYGAYRVLDYRAIPDLNAVNYEHRALL